MDARSNPCLQTVRLSLDSAYDVVAPCARVASSRLTGRRTWPVRGPGDNSPATGAVEFLRVLIRSRAAGAMTHAASRECVAPFRAGWRVLVDVGRFGDRVSRRPCRPSGERQRCERSLPLAVGFSQAGADELGPVDRRSAAAIRPGSTRRPCTGLHPPRSPLRPPSTRSSADGLGEPTISTLRISIARDALCLYAELPVTERLDASAWQAREVLRLARGLSTISSRCRWPTTGGRDGREVMPGRAGAARSP
jgi:hypothetical protein